MNRHQSCQTTYGREAEANEPKDADGSTPTVSVVIPTYDRPDMLAEAIVSVLNQTHDPVELVVIDDGSPTSARPVVESPAENAVFHGFDHNRGANVARNEGIRPSSGEYVAFLDDDDRWELHGTALLGRANQRYTRNPVDNGGRHSRAVRQAIRESHRTRGVGRRRRSRSRLSGSPDRTA